MDESWEYVQSDLKRIEKKGGMIGENNCGGYGGGTSCTEVRVLGVFLDPTLPFIAHRFASRPISPVAASSEEVTADWRERQRAVENETRKCDVILAEG